VQIQRGGRRPCTDRQRASVTASTEKLRDALPLIFDGEELPGPNSEGLSNSGNFRAPLKRIGVYIYSHQAGELSPLPTNCRRQWQ